MGGGKEERGGSRKREGDREGYFYSDHVVV